MGNNQNRTNTKIGRSIRDVGRWQNKKWQCKKNRKGNVFRLKAKKFLCCFTFIFSRCIFIKFMQYNEHYYDNKKSNLAQEKKIDSFKLNENAFVSCKF